MFTAEILRAKKTSVSPRLSVSAVKFYNSVFSITPTQ